MEMSAAALWGDARRAAELFDAGSSAEGREPAPPRRRGAEEEGEEAAAWCEEPGAALEKVKVHCDCWTTGEPECLAPLIALKHLFYLDPLTGPSRIGGLLSLTFIWMSEVIGEHLILCV